MSLGATESRRCEVRVKVNVKMSMKEVVGGLFAETFGPTEVQKSCRQLRGKLGKFQPFRNSIAKSASGVESLH